VGRTQAWTRKEMGDAPEKKIKTAYSWGGGGGAKKKLLTSVRRREPLPEGNGGKGVCRIISQ